MLKLWKPSQIGYLLIDELLGGGYMMFMDIAFVTDCKLEMYTDKVKGKDKGVPVL
jgi:hypothetical protein